MIVPVVRLRSTLPDEDVLANELRIARDRSVPGIKQK